MDRKDYLKSRISEALKGPIEESYKKKYETAPEGVKAVADHMAMLKKQPTDTLKRMTNQHYKVHSAKSKNEFVGMLMRAKFGKKKLEAHDSHFQTEQKQSLAEESNDHPAIQKFAAIQHDNWRKGFDPENTGKERIKKNSDGTEGNINVPFHKLHPDWQKENLAAGRAAYAAIQKHPKDPEKASEHVHNEWMKRNPKADYNADQHVPYNKLPENEKEKDREHVRTMNRLVGEVKPVNEASQKLMNYLRDKHGAALQKMSSPELQKAKKAAAAEMKAKTAEKKAAAAEAPKEKVKDTGEHIVVQMRKIADYKPGKYPVRVSPKRSVNVHSDAARKVVASHDELKKPVDKRKFRISLTKRLRKLKEERARC